MSDQDAVDELLGDEDSLDELLNDEGPAPRRHWALRVLRDLGVAVLLFVVLSTGLSWLRAPDLPDQAPAFALANLEGETVSLEQFRGQKVVLNFWATWCGPCRVEVPAFSWFARNHPDVPVLGIAVDGSVGQLKRAREDLGIDYPVLVADPATVKAYGAYTLPTTVVVDEDGSVSAVHVGIMTPPQLWWATW